MDTATCHRCKHHDKETYTITVCRCLEIARDVLYKDAQGKTRFDIYIPTSSVNKCINFLPWRE